MAVGTFFNSSSKKRDLSDQSCNGEEPKKAREGSLNNSSVSLYDPFTEGMKSPECFYILVNCIKNIETKIKEIYETNQAAQDNQIKGECKLRDLVKSIEFYNEKCNELGKDNRKKQEEVNELKEKTRKMDKKIGDLTDMGNTVVETAFWCMMLKENENEDTDVIVTETLNKLSQEKLTDVDID